MNSGRPRVLLIEDDWHTTLLIHRALEFAGYAVAVSSTVAGAIALLKTFSFSVAVVDLMLPDGEGTEILLAAKEMRHRPKFVVVTAISGPERLKDVRAAGPDLILTKPFKFWKLLQFLELAASGGGSAGDSGVMPSPVSAPDDHPRGNGGEIKV